MNVRRLEVAPSVLGEGPVWSERDQCLYFVDIVSRRVQAYWPGTQAHRVWPFDSFVGSLAECRSGGLVVALGDRLVRFHPERGSDALEELAVLERDRPGNRLNDGKVDPWGRFWVGSMRIAEDARAGRLWCVSPDGQATVVRDDIGVSNSLAFDRARNRMYFADSMSGAIELNQLDAAGAPGPWQPFAKAGQGAPDGSCTDADGYLWNAEWGGWRLCRYAPDGTLDRVLDLPVSRPSSCAFGGADHRTLFVTSAQYNLTPEERRRDPHAGSLFSVELPDIQGLPADLFAL